MRKFLNFIEPYVKDHPRLLAILLLPLVITMSIFTTLVVFPLDVLDYGIRNWRWSAEDCFDPMVGTWKAILYALINNELGEFE